MKRIAVGSENPIKIEAVQLGFEAVWPQEKWVVSGVKTTSGVSNQPMSDAESIRGARTRAQTALETTEADFGVGLEGGLQEVEGMWFDNGWIVVRNTAGVEGVGSTLRIITPPKMMEYVEQGMEVGSVDDLLFRAENSKQKNGHFGVMTNNLLTRTDGYRQGVVAALARFLHPQLFEKTVKKQKITICGSIAFSDEMAAVAQELTSAGLEVKFPPTQELDEHGKPMSAKKYYDLRKATVDPTSWIWRLKTQAMMWHFEKVAWADAILVLNYDKNDIANYIGANTLLEMSLAFYLGKPIYLLNLIPDVAYTEEILGMNPIVIHGDLMKLTKVSTHIRELTSK